MTGKHMDIAEYDADDLKDPIPHQGPRVPKWLAVAITLGVGTILFLTWANLYTSWLWFQQLGYQSVFSTELVAGWSLFGVGFVVSSLFLWFNLRLAVRLAPASIAPARVITIEGQRVMLPDFSEWVARIVLPASLLAGFLFGSRVSGNWESVLTYLYQTPFGDVDPIFGRDIGFYVFTLPVLQMLGSFLEWVIGVSIIGVVIVYLVNAGLGTRVFSLGQILTRKPLAHLATLGAGLFLVFAYRAWLSMPELLLSTGGPFAGAGYTDIFARKPLIWAEIVACILMASGAVVSARIGSVKPIVVAGAVYALALLGALIYPGTVQRFSVAPNELAFETPYIQNNILATRKAYGLDQIEERELTAEQALTATDLQNNQATINNIRLWDRTPLLGAFSQIQEIRTYYDFVAVDIDRYPINGEMRQVMLSPRELSSDALPNRNWINERLTFTHGFGLTLGPVNQVTEEGLPVLFVKDIPPTSPDPSLKVDRPEIYFGELSNDRVYVNTRAAEFNYPSGEDNVFATYEGTGGVSIGSNWKQMLFALRFGDMKLLLSNDLTPDSRVLFHRNIAERLQMVAPFLRFDKDPYMVISGGRLFWIADAYTVTDRYPYAEPMGDINYIRNSVKAVVDAYNGDVTLYLVDETDPIAQTYARVFPGIFKPLADMPEALRAHLRYPEDIFRIQTAVYSTYHMGQTQVFYNKEDQWAVAAVPSPDKAGEVEQIEPYYTIMKLPNEQSEEYILMLPFTPQRKDNLSAWMVARSDGEHYGKLAVYRLPKQRLVFGPKQVIGRINQDPEISRQLSLWNQRGSKVIFGHLMVIPIEESLIYVQPLYLLAETGKIPELRRVIVVAENRIAMEPTLEASVSRLFGAPTPKPDGEPAPTPGEGEPPPSADVSALAVEARKHYDAAIQAQRDGDWARYGEEIKQLGEVLGRMGK